MDIRKTAPASSLANISGAPPTPSSLANISGALPTPILAHTFPSPSKDTYIIFMRPPPLTSSPYFKGVTIFFSILFFSALILTLSLLFVMNLPIISAGVLLSLIVTFLSALALTIIPCIAYIRRGQDEPQDFLRISTTKSPFLIKREAARVSQEAILTSIDSATDMAGAVSSSIEGYLQSMRINIRKKPPFIRITKNMKELSDCRSILEEKPNKFYTENILEYIEECISEALHLREGKKKD